MAVKFCPVCGQEQSCRIETGPKKYKVRGQEVTIEAPVCICDICGTELLDEDSTDKRLRLIYEEYRLQNDIISPEQIAEIRADYGLSQRALSKLLGWGPITIQRYEKGAIPDEAHNLVLKSLRDPIYMKHVLETRGTVLEARRRESVENALEEVNRTVQIETIIGSTQPSLENGFRKLDFNRFAHMIVFFATQCPPLWKTKLMKLLFYSDFSHYRNYALSISGAHYARLPRGPVPHRYDALLGLLEEEGIIELQPDFCGDYEGEVIVPKMQFNQMLFSDDELDTLKAISANLGGNSARVLSELSHQERAWQDNRTGNIISYDYADELSGI